MDKREDFYNSYFQGFKTLFPELTREEFLSYYDEDQYLGYPDLENSGGGVWTSEGISIYVLIRILKPKNIIELGNFVGISSNHILSAVEKNQFGNVTLLDKNEFLVYDKIHNRNFIRIIANSLDYLNNSFDYDLIIQDSDHSYSVTKKEIEIILDNNISKNYYIWSHDYFTPISANINVYDALNDMKINFYKFEMFKDSISDCGFSIANINKL